MGVLLLIAALSLNLALWQASLSVAQAWQDAYRGLEAREQSLRLEEPDQWPAWGQNWTELPPRIDFGAYSERDRDAEALCFFQNFVPSSEAGTSWRCD